MREILFRGQTRRKGEKVRMDGTPIDSNWVYGGIFPNNDDGDFAIIYQQEPEIEKFTVYSDTVGQYTGLTDKNGKKIFEGDILLAENGDKKIYVSVGFGKFADVNSLDDDKQLGFYISCRGECSTILNGESDGVAIYDMCTVIGNIFDNPELMELNV